MDGLFLMGVCERRFSGFGSYGVSNLLILDKRGPDRKAHGMDPAGIVGDGQLESWVSLCEDFVRTLPAK